MSILPPREHIPATPGDALECGHDWWCVVGERDYLDEPVTFVCSDGCGDADEDDWEADA